MKRRKLVDVIGSESGSFEERRGAGRLDFDGLRVCDRRGGAGGEAPEEAGAEGVVGVVGVEGEKIPAGSVAANIKLGTLSTVGEVGAEIGGEGLGRLVVIFGAGWNLEECKRVAVDGMSR